MDNQSGLIISGYFMQTSLLLSGWLWRIAGWTAAILFLIVFLYTAIRLVAAIATGVQV